MNNFWITWILALGFFLAVAVLLMIFVPAPFQVPSHNGSLSGAIGSQITIGKTSIGILELVEDSRCPIDVQCIQAGTVRVRVAINAMNRDFIFTLGEAQTVGNLAITLSAVIPVEKYSTLVVPASEYRFTFTVEEPTVRDSGGNLLGAMTIGPICPVERKDAPCLPTPEMYAAQKVYVYSSDRKTLVTTLTPDASGAFSTTLQKGEYWIDVVHNQIGGFSGVPALIEIKSGENTSISIDIDTGIR